MDPAELYKSGQLNEAIQASTAAVKQSPADLAQRSFLAELLCLSGNFDRADAQLDVISKQSPEAMVGVSLQRQLIRAARARQEHFEAGRAPELLTEASPWLRLALEAIACRRAGDQGRAAELLQESEAKRPASPGRRNGEAFDDCRDLDDQFAGVFEVLTSTGKYYWVPTHSVTRLEVRKPERPIDLLWLPTEMSVKDGPDGVVYLPTIYGETEGDEALLLGRGTDWVEGDSETVRGRGLRMFLVGEQDLAPMELGEIEFDEPAATEAN